jgi:hypothetical protein
MSQLTRGVIHLADGDLEESCLSHLDDDALDWRGRGDTHGLDGVAARGGPRGTVV